MRRYTLVCIMLLLCSMVVGASPVSFKIFPGPALFPAAVADPYSPHTRLNILQIKKGIPHELLVTNKNGSGSYESLEFREEKKMKDLYFRFKVGENISLARLSLGGIQAEVGMSGYMNSVFALFGGSDNLGFDGSYAVFGALDFFGVVTLRGGIHHFSGHYGDEILEDALKNKTVSYSRLVEYTRDNSWYAGVSVRPTDSFRFYIDAERPMGSSWLRPAVHVPEDIKVPDSEDGEMQDDKASHQEGIKRDKDYASSYHAWRINAGFEFRIPVASTHLLLAADVQAHQDGQTLHQVGGYSPDNPWEFEYSLGVGLEFAELIGGRVLRLEAFYHDSRFPLLNFFYQRSRFFSVGISVNG